MRASPISIPPPGPSRHVRVWPGVCIIATARLLLLRHVTYLPDIHTDEKADDCARERGLLLLSPLPPSVPRMYVNKRVWQCALTRATANLPARREYQVVITLAMTLEAAPGGLLTADAAWPWRGVRATNKGRLTRGLASTVPRSIRHVRAGTHGWAIIIPAEAKHLSFRAGWHTTHDTHGGCVVMWLPCAWAGLLAPLSRAIHADMPDAASRRMTRNTDACPCHADGQDRDGPHPGLHAGTDDGARGTFCLDRSEDAGLADRRLGWKTSPLCRTAVARGSWLLVCGGLVFRPLLDLRTGGHSSKHTDLCPFNINALINQFYESIHGETKLNDSVHGLRISF